MNRLDKIERIMEKLAISQAQTDAQIARTEAQMAENSAQMAETRAQIAETDAHLRASDDRLTKKLDTIGKLVGSIGNGHGEIAEEFFFNTISDKLKLAGIEYDFVDKNVTRNKHGVQDEYDIFMVNGKDIAIIEVKYKAHENDVDRLIHKKYKNFKKLFPEYRNFNHHLALASFKVHDDVIKQAREQGVIVLQRRGDVFETTLPD